MMAYLPSDEEFTEEDFLNAADDGAIESLLNQDEIDSLLGNDDDGQGNVGIDAILKSGKVSYERLPMLEVVIDRLVRLLSTNLRNFTGETVEVDLDDINSVRVGDYIEQIPEPALIGVFDVKEWTDSPGLITGDARLFYSVVDVLLGAKRGQETPNVETRPYTTIERGLVQRLLNLILKDFSTSFQPISPVNFELDRIENNPSFAMISRPVNVAIIVKLNIKIESKGGKLEFLIPYSSLEPVRDKLLQMFMGEKFGQDSVWEKHFAGELWETKIPIKGVLKTLSANLNDVLQWKKGSQLMLDVKADTPITIKSGDLVLGHGRMGKKNNHIAIQIEKTYIKDKQDK